MRKILESINKLKRVTSLSASTPFKFIYYKIFNLNILASRNTFIKGANNIKTKGLLKIGITDTGFSHATDITTLNIKGKIIFNDDFSISKGCRLDIGPNAKASFGRGYVNNGSRFIIMHGITIGNNCAISWDCQFLDENFHNLSYEGRVERDNTIHIGNDCWIGSRVIILPGVNIPDGCIIAAGSVVASSFTEEKCLIAGNPARVIRKKVTWN